MTSRRINSPELIKQQVVGKLEILRGKASQKLDCMHQFHGRLRVFE
jgi:hypothetical protein